MGCVRRVGGWMQKDITRILFEAMLDKSLRDLNSNSRRAVRNLVDMGVHFSKGRFQKYFLSCVQTMLQNEESAYYDLITDMTEHVDRKILFTFGMNLGYNGCTKGAKVIREVEKKNGYNVPWALSLWVDQEKMLHTPDTYQQIIRQGSELGIYVYLLFLENGQAETLLPLLKAWPDCAFVLFLKNTEISDEFVEAVRRCSNTMISIYADGQTDTVCERLRENRLLYGLHYGYGEADREKLLKGKWLEENLEKRPYFTFLIPDDSCGEQLQEDVYQQILSVRNSQSHAVFCIELKRDLQRIDAAISEDACLLGFNGDGSIRTCKGTESGADRNIFVNGLEEVLRFSAPRER